MMKQNKNKAFFVEQVPEGVRLCVVPFEGSGRERECEAINYLVKNVLNIPDDIVHNKDGKPFIAGYNISITHTRGWAAVMVSDNYEVGVDIEFRSERVNRIASRFLRSDEKLTDTESRLIAWCAKESLYKLCSSQHLAYEEMKVDIESDIIHNLKSAESYPYNKLLARDFILVWMIKQ